MSDVKHSSTGFERHSRDRLRADKSKDARHADSKRDREAESRDR
jgi:hypothetical protein